MSRGNHANSVFPPNDTLICDPSGTRTPQLMTAISMQNYGVNSYMIRQPFDFAGRTGKIVFDVDAVDQGLGGFIEIELTEDPMPATTFREYQNFEVGPVPRNGLRFRFVSFANVPAQSLQSIPSSIRIIQGQSLRQRSTTATVALKRKEAH